MRQKPDSYDPKKDSPLIGGYNARENVNFSTEPEVGWGPYVRTAELIGLLEQAAEEFPSKEMVGGWGEDELWYYDSDEVDAWKCKWLTVPPV